MNKQRPFVVAANWKMNKSPREALEFLKAFEPSVRELPERKQLVFFVPAIDLWVVQEFLRNTKICFGAQNCHYLKSGALTGENSPQVLAEIGAQFTLVGHSERRSLFLETDEDCARKVETLQSLKITPMLCVGETLFQREKGETAQVITQQLTQGLSRRIKGEPVQIAYEPVWAIGTGKVATSEQANEAHQVLRQCLAKIENEHFAQLTPILYGGSVKPDNAEELSRQPEIDGFLVGGASLEVKSFLALANVP